MSLADWSAAGLHQILFLQQLAPALDPLMQAVSALGAMPFYLVLLPFIYWTLDPGLATRTLCLLLLNDVANASLKMALHEPRPYWLPDTGVRALGGEASYSLPSGHASGSLVVWGSLALHWRQRGAVVLAVALIGLIGLSRPWLGVHFPHDVLAGWLLGATLLLLMHRLWPRWRDRCAALPTRRLLGIAAALAGAIMAWGVFLPAWLGGRADPPAWAALAAGARHSSGFFALAGVLFGLLAGQRRLADAGGYAPPPRWPQRGACFVVGMLGVGLIYGGLGVLAQALAAPESAGALALRFARFAALAWWVSELAPRLFLRYPRWLAGVPAARAGE